MTHVGLSQFLCLLLGVSVARAQDSASVSTSASPTASSTPPAQSSVAPRPSNRQFQWKWANDGIGFSLPTCLELIVEVKSWDVQKNDTFGIPPYYMMAFPVGGTPTTTLMGSDNTTLRWTNTHAPGSTLLLTVVDASGSFGGVPPRLYTSIEGVSAQCVVPEPKAPTFSISSNITGNLETCQPWGITIKGGIAPYNLSIAAVNSPVITNVTIPSGFDAFTYINRADPNGQMVVGVADFTGRWASGVPLVNTTGSENVDCTGLVSASGIASNLEKEAEARKKASDKKRTAIIAGVTVPLVLLLLAAIGAGVWFFLRRKKQQAKEPKEVEPYSYREEPLTLPNGAYSRSTGFSGTSKGALSHQESNGALSYAANSPNGLGSPSVHGSFGAPSSSAGFSSQETRNTGHFSTFPARPISGKAGEAAQEVVLAPEESEYASGSGANRADEIVIQHQDGGVVRELPPPYADRSRETEP